MKEYFVGMGYHDPSAYKLYLDGVLEDFEGATAVFIKADSESEAIIWGANIAKKLFEFENPSENISWESLYDIWIEKDIQNSGWLESVGFFQKVIYGEYPDFSKMGAESYKQWLKVNNPDWYNKYIKK